MDYEGPVIILLEHREEYQAIYGMNLTLYLGAKVLVANTIKSSIDLIHEHNAVLLFVNNDAYSQDMGAEIWKLFDQQRIAIPLFILGASKVPMDLVTVFDSRIQLRDILRSIAQTINVTVETMMEKDHPDFFLLPSEFIIPGWMTAIEIFIHTNDGYEVYFDIDEIITNDKLQKLGNDSNFQLYVEKDERLKFVNSLTGQISAKLNDPNITPEIRAELTATGHQMVMEQSRKIGITQATMELANSCISSMLTIVDEAPKLNDLLMGLMMDTMSLRYKHSLLINYIGSHIIKKTKWGSREQQEKFSFVSFFHNIALTKDEHVLIHSDRELEESDLPENEKKLVSRHAIMAAKLINEIEDRIPFGAATIIKQHHGSSRGVGLSKLSLNISPLAIVFLFAEEWANLVLKFENQANRPTKEEIIKMLSKKYNKPAFNKILPILHTLEF